jgi:hemoglobin
MEWTTDEPGGARPGERLGGEKMTESSLYERLGGAFAIAAVVDHFSEAVVRNPIVGQKSENAALREWHTHNLGRLPGLKFMRTLWVCDVAGGPQQYAATKPGGPPLGLEEAHRELKIAPAEFDEVAAELAEISDAGRLRLVAASVSLGSAGISRLASTFDRSTVCATELSETHVSERSQRSLATPNVLT